MGQGVFTETSQINCFVEENLNHTLGYEIFRKLFKIINIIFNSCTEKIKTRETEAPTRTFCSIE